MIGDQLRPQRMEWPRAACDGERGDGCSGRVAWVRPNSRCACRRAETVGGVAIGERPSHRRGVPEACCCLGVPACARSVGAGRRFAARRSICSSGAQLPSSMDSSSDGPRIGWPARQPIDVIVKSHSGQRHSAPTHAKRRRGKRTATCWPVGSWGHSLTQADSRSLRLKRRRIRETESRVPGRFSIEGRGARTTKTNTGAHRYRVPVDEE